MKKKMEILRKLHRTERACWIILLACVFFLFKWGIDLEYEQVSSVTISVLHTLTVILTLVVSMFQVSVTEKIDEIESVIFDDEE